MGQDLLRCGAADVVATHDLGDADAIAQASGHAVAQYRGRQLFLFRLRQCRGEGLIRRVCQQGIAASGLVIGQTLLHQHAKAGADQRARHLECARELLFRQGIADPHAVFLGEIDDPPGQLQVVGAGLFLCGLAQCGSSRSWARRHAKDLMP
ncbi:hypothetical protein D9M70_540360 [compost metagenome]